MKLLRPIQSGILQCSHNSFDFFFISNEYLGAFHVSANVTVVGCPNMTVTFFDALPPPIGYCQLGWILVMVLPPPCRTPPTPLLLPELLVSVFNLIIDMVYFSDNEIKYTTKVNRALLQVLNLAWNMLRLTTFISTPPPPEMWAIMDYSWDF
jgi:hypothetical protein